MKRRRLPALVTACVLLLQSIVFAVGAGSSAWAHDASDAVCERQSEGPAKKAPLEAIRHACTGCILCAVAFVRATAVADHSIRYVLTASEPREGDIRPPVADLRSRKPPSHAPPSSA